MEDVLELYAEPLDEARPVVCMDELSKALHGQVAEPIPPEPKRTKKEDYEYTRNGTANVFLLLCPLLGWRHLEVTARRGYLQFAQVMKALVDVHFPKAERIRVVLDNLNTHTPAALYEAFPPAEARRVLRRLEFHYTPVHGSWLNMAEIEFSLLSRQCLGRRIPDRDILATEVAGWEAARNEQRSTIRWQFTVDDARTKLHRLYPS
jgi:hypothetical protein